MPMATPSIAALYPNSDAPSSAKKSLCTYSEVASNREIFRRAPSVRRATLNALLHADPGRGGWPGERNHLRFSQWHDAGKRRGRRQRGALDGALAGAAGRQAWLLAATAQGEFLVELPQVWRGTSDGKMREVPLRGPLENSGGEGQLRRVLPSPHVRNRYREVPARPPAKGIRHFDARTYTEYKQAAKQGEHPNVTPIRQPAKPAEPPRDPAPAAPLPAREQPAAEHKPEHHRSSQRTARKLTPREGPKLVNEIRRLMRGSSSFVEAHSGLEVNLRPDDPRYRAPMSQEHALIAACMNLAIPEEAAREFLKLLPRQDLGESEQEQGP